MTPGGFEPLKTYTVADSATWPAPAFSGNRILVKDMSTIALWTVNWRLSTNLVTRFWCDGEPAGIDRGVQRVARSATGWGAQQTAAAAPNRRSYGASW